MSCLFASIAVGVAVVLNRFELRRTAATGYNARGLHYNETYNRISINLDNDAGWSSLEARWAHNPEVAGSNPAPATK